MFGNVLYYCSVEYGVYLMSSVEEKHEYLVELRIEVEQEVDHNFEEIIFASERVV